MGPEIYEAKKLINYSNSPTHKHYLLYGCKGGSWNGAYISLFGNNLSKESILSNGLGTSDECDVGFVKLNMRLIKERGAA